MIWARIPAVRLYAAYSWLFNIGSASLLPKAFGISRRSSLFHKPAFAPYIAAIRRAFLLLLLTCKEESLQAVRSAYSSRPPPLNGVVGLIFPGLKPKATKVSHLQRFRSWIVQMTTLFKL